MISNGWPPIANRFADRRDRAEQLALHLGADEGDAAPQPHVVVVEETSAGLRRLASHRAVRRRDAAHEVARLLVAVDDRELCMNSGLTFFTSGSSPIASTSSAVTRTRLPARSPPACRLVWPGNANDRAVGERAAKARVERGAEAIAVRQQHDDRDDAPRDAEHRQRRAEAVVIEAVTNASRTISRRMWPAKRCWSIAHISNRSASTGGSSAARRAGYVDVTTPIATRVASDESRRLPRQHHAGRIARASAPG